MSQTKTEEDKHAAGGPGKAAKKGHVEPGKGNAPSQKQSPKDDGPGGGGGTRGVPDEKRRPAGS